jgi:exodeoxyribonuclease VII large subunit
MQDMVESERQRLERLSPSRQAAADRQHLDDMVALMSVRLRHKLALDRERVNGSRARLDALSPLQILKRGYAIVRDLDTNSVVSSISDTRPGHLLEVRVSDGAFGARVERSVKEKTDGRE